MKPRRNTQRDRNETGRVYHTECSRPHVYTWPRCLKRPHDYTYKGTRSKEEERKRDEEAERRHDVCACECMCAGETCRGEIRRYRSRG